MDQFHSFHTKIQTLANLNESIVNSHFPEELGRCPTRRDGTLTSADGSEDDDEAGRYHAHGGRNSKDQVEIKAASGERGPPTHLPKLPTEIVELILRNFTKPELLPALRANKAVYSIAVRLLYREIVEHDKPKPCISLIRQILKNPSVHPHIRKLDINISSVEVPTANFYRLLNQLLNRTMALTSLMLDFPKSQSPVWILEGCSFKLKLFSTSMHCTPVLARFLNTQPHITQLTLRGFQSDALKSLPYIYMDIKNSISSGLLATAESELDQFALEEGALKSLNVFNAIHAGPVVVKQVVQGRPVHTASIPLFSMNAYQSLDALEGSTVPLKRLSVISFDPNAPTFIFEQVARRFSDLEALHIVVLLAEFTNELLLEACSHLHRFKRLKYITCVATSPEESSVAEEQEVAEKWHKECPTLRTIILPKGRVWFHKPARMSSQRNWECLDD